MNVRAVFSGRRRVRGPKPLGQVALAAEAAVFGDTRDRKRRHRQQLASLLEPGREYVAMRRCPHRLLEHATKVNLADLGLLREDLRREVIAQMIVDVAEHGLQATEVNMDGSVQISTTSGVDWGIGEVRITRDGALVALIFTSGTNIRSEAYAPLESF